MQTHVDAAALIHVFDGVFKQGKKDLVGKPRLQKARYMRLNVFGKSKMASL
ncbi:MAG: hypothetical protein LBI64_08145 [Coriobacteriales bacterium]|nr:hypothetical protein [Coriobacteriales bacterium]